MYKQLNNIGLQQKHLHLQNTHKHGIEKLIYIIDVHPIKNQ